MRQARLRLRYTTNNSQSLRQGVALDLKPGQNHIDEGGQLEFTVENVIDHTPKDELVRLYTGDAFDPTGERHRLDYRLDSRGRSVDENFEINVRNHKTTAAEVRIVEHCYQWSNWEIIITSDPFNKADSQTVAFTVQVPEDGEKVVSYQVHYSW